MSSKGQSTNQDAKVPLEFHEFEQGKQLVSRTRYAHWKSAIYDSGITKSTGKEFTGQWQRLETLPSFIKRVYKQQEVCPKTGRLHYQIHVHCGRAIDLKFLCNWIPFTKWFACVGKKSIENSIAYCSKSETAVAGTYQEQQGDFLQIDEVLLLISKEVDPYFAITPEEYRERTYKNGKEYNTEVAKAFLKARKDAWDFKTLTTRMVMKDMTVLRKLTNPTLPRMWSYWGEAIWHKSNPLGNPAFGDVWDED